MADAVTLDQWQGTDVALGVVLDTLGELRRRSARTAARTSVMTLVVVAADDGEASRARAAMLPLGDHHPARVVILRPDRDAGEARVDASLTISGSVGSPQSTSFEEISLGVKAEGCDHLDSIVEPFTLADLPVVVWYPGALPEVCDCLLPMAGTVVVDSKEAGGPSTFDRLLELSRLRAVVDLSWERLLPWREMLAGMFEGAAFRPFVTGVTSVAVSGKPGPRHLLGGWISSRLGLPPDAVELSDARHVSLRLRCEHRGAKASFEAVRTEGERLVRGRAVIEGGPRNQEMLPLPADSLSWFLAKALTHLEPDPTWREAVEAANGLGP